MSKHIKNVRQQARKHHKNHLYLKELLSLPIKREQIFELFLGTFVATLVTIFIFMNWGKIVSFFITEGPKPSEIVTEGAEKGVLSNYQIDVQSQREYNFLLAQIVTEGYKLGIQSTQEMGKGPKVPTEANQNGLQTSILITNELSLGNHLTSLDQGEVKGLMKSIISTFYLGEKTVTIHDTISLDAKILGQIKNALSIDLFQYLDQSAYRADQLKGYLNLLNALHDQARERMNDLNAKIIFLENNAGAHETRISFTEEQFFNQLELFNGPNAQQNLESFIGLQSEQSEIRAKQGAYRGLLEYYEFFLPRLENMILAVNANQDALVAGVKITAIQDMTLPLIIQP